MSCATSVYKINTNELLPYKESSQITKITEKLSAIKINSVKDKRDRLNIGKAYTGVQYNETPINLNESVQVYVKNFMENALTMRNIEVDPYSQNLFDVEVNHIWVEEVIEKFKPERAKCKVDLSFHLTADGKKWSGNFWTEFTSAGDLSDGTERLAPTLASCMNAVVEKLVLDEKFIDFLREKN